MRVDILLVKLKWDVSTQHLINIHVRWWRVGTKLHSNNHLPSCKSSRTGRAGSSISGGELNGWMRGMLSLSLRPHTSLLRPGSRLQTSLPSLPCEGTGLVWRALTATTSRVTSLHCHTSLQSEWPLHPHRCAVSDCFFSEGWNMAVLTIDWFKSKCRHWKIQWISMWTCEQMSGLSGKTVHTTWMDKTDIYFGKSRTKTCMQKLMGHWSL